MRDRLERLQKAGKQRRGEMEALSAQLAAAQQLLAKAEQVSNLRRLLELCEPPLSHKKPLGHGNPAEQCLP